MQEQAGELAEQTRLAHEATSALLALKQSTANFDSTLKVKETEQVALQKAVEEANAQIAQAAATCHALQQKVRPCTTDCCLVVQAVGEHTHLRADMIVLKGLDPPTRLAVCLICRAHGWGSHDHIIVHSHVITLPQPDSRLVVTVLEDVDVHRETRSERSYYKPLGLCSNQ